MSDITIPYPEAVNGHTDVICSTDIRHVVTV
ncbi:TPA: restriction endonuclease subunit M, partial [Escherichia coli]|nr:restriction endonuclease subunit M [Escherichia coli]